MNNKTTLVLILTIAIIIIIIVVGYILRQREPIILQGIVECTTYRASSKIAGRIEEIMVTQGQHVEKGELLYRLSTPELNAKLLQAQAVKRAAEAMDQKALSGARQQQIEAARNLWQKAQAGTTLSRQTYQRIKTLYEKGVVAAQKYDEALAAYEAAQATESAAKAEYDLAVAGASSEDREAAAAQVRQAAASVSEVESYIDDAMVYAPITGEVSTIVAEAGELVGSGFPVISLIDTADKWITFNVKETLLPRIEIGREVVGYVPALGYDISLTITYISVQADFATWSATRTSGGFDIRTFAIKARPTDTENHLCPGMSVLVDWNAL